MAHFPYGISVPMARPSPWNIPPHGTSFSMEYPSPWHGSPWHVPPYGKSLPLARLSRHLLAPPVRAIPWQGIFPSSPRARSAFPAAPGEREPRWKIPGSGRERHGPRQDHSRRDNGGFVGVVVAAGAAGISRDPPAAAAFPSQQSASAVLPAGSGDPSAPSRSRNSAERNFPGIPGEPPLPPRTPGAAGGPGMLAVLQRSRHLSHARLPHSRPRHAPALGISGKTGMTEGGEEPGLTPGAAAGCGVFQRWLGIPGLLICVQTRAGGAAAPFPKARSRQEAPGSCRHSPE